MLLFLTFAVAAAGSGLLVRWSRDDATAASPPAAEATSGTIPNAAGAVAQADTTSDPSVRVTATGSRVQFLIDSAKTPRTVTVILDQAGSARPLQRQVRLTTARAAVVFTDVPTGTATWTVRSDDVDDLNGVVTVPGAGSPDGSNTGINTGTTAAGGPVAPAPGSSATASTHAGSGTASSGSGSNTPVTPPKPPSTPKPATPPKTPKPSKPPVSNPEPTGPASPYDPDDH